MEMQRTLALIKPDATQHATKIKKMIHDYGFTIVTAKYLWMTLGMAELFYHEHREKDFFGPLVEHMTSGPVVAMVLEEETAISLWRGLIGATDPSKADPGTIRQVFAKEGDPIFKNVAHGSDSPESAAREISLVFSGFDLLGT